MYSKHDVKPTVMLYCKSKATSKEINEDWNVEIMGSYFAVTDFKIIYIFSFLLVVDGSPTTWTYLWAKYWHVIETIYIMG